MAVITLKLVVQSVLSNSPPLGMGHRSELLQVATGLLKVTIEKHITY